MVYVLLTKIYVMLYFNQHGFKQCIKHQPIVFVVKAWQYVLNRFTVFCLIFIMRGKVITWKEKGHWSAADEKKFRCINQLLPSSLIIFTCEFLKYTSRENCVGKWASVLNRDTKLVKNVTVATAQWSYFQVASLPQVSQTKPCICLSYLPYMPHAPPISIFLI
jgi:hypothetical protein